MSLTTLLDFFPRFEALGTREAVRFDNGFRSWVYTYRQLCREIGGFAGLLHKRGLKKGDRLLLWCENRPEWLIAFWGCLARGVQVVPIDYRFSVSLLLRIHREVDARLIVFGESVQALPGDLPVLPAAQVAGQTPAELDPVPAAPEDIVQIVYTSGTTGNPRGVIHRHGNLCANLSPVQTEIERYRRYARPFQPIRILSLLPLSHVFGQAVALFVPPILGGSAVFMDQIHPEAMIRVVRSSRVSVMGVVPRMLDSLRQEISRSHGLKEVPPLGTGWIGAARRWWKYRSIHRRFGWKFWCFVVGGAAVPQALEAFWSRLGFAVVQGYGLTESSPMVAVNHPFHARQGSIGKAVPGQEVKLGPDGEILVRGPSIATEFLGGPPESGTRVVDGWLHTGDLGRMDESGRIFFLGRKKETIVTSAGMNVFPEDVEVVLRKQPGLRDCAVVGRSAQGRETVHASLILDESGVPPETIVREANRQLEPHQRIQSWTLWPEADFPRTASTFKIKRAEIARRLVAPGPEAGPADSPETGVDVVLDRLSASTLNDGDLERDLGLSSLDRVELLGRLEDRFAVRIDDQRFSRLNTVGAVRQELERLRSEGVRPAPEKAGKYPFWASRAPVTWLRRLLLDWVLLPAQRRLVRVEAHHLERLSELSGPAIFAANHASHLDSTVVMAALPPRWRHRLAPAMRQEYFRAYFEPAGVPWRVRARSALKYFLACGLFHGYPLPRKMGGVRSSLRFSGYLVERGDCPLIFPEGARTPDGRLLPFRDGVGLMALQLGIPVVPVYIRGTRQVWSKFDRRPTRRGDVDVLFGSPLYFKGGDDASSAAKQVERAVQDLERAFVASRES